MIKLKTMTETQLLFKINEESIKRVIKEGKDDTSDRRLVAAYNMALDDAIHLWNGDDDFTEEIESLRIEEPSKMTKREIEIYNKAIDHAVSAASIEYSYQPQRLNDLNDVIALEKSKFNPVCNDTLTVSGEGQSFTAIRIDRNSIQRLKIKEIDE